MIMQDDFCYEQIFTCLFLPNVAKILRPFPVSYLDFEARPLMRMERIASAARHVSVLLVAAHAVPTVV